jgi:uncharacterized protein
MFFFARRLAILILFFKLLLACVATASAHTPGFVCNDPRNVAKLICADQELSALDVQMTQAYFALRADMVSENLQAGRAPPPVDRARQQVAR